MRPAPRSRSTIYPYVLGNHARMGRAPLLELGALDVVLVCWREGASTLLWRDDLEALGHDPGRQFLRARDNLMALTDAQLIPHTICAGPRGAPCLAFRHPLAAACALLPQLHDLAERKLRSDRLTMAMPRRDLLLVFASPVAPRLDVEAHDFVSVLATGRSALTDELFLLERSGPSCYFGPNQYPLLADEIEVEVEVDAA